MSRNPREPDRLSPVYAVFGSEDFLRSRAISDLIRRVLGPHRDAMALAEFDGETANMADILDEVRTGSLLAPTRVVIVRNADVLVTKKRREKSDTDHESKDDSAKANREALEKYIQSPCPTGVLVLVFNSLATSTRLYQLVEKLGGNISCKPPEKGLMPWLNQWLGAHARDAYRCALEPAAHKRLIDLVGTTLGLLDMELSKLATYIAPRTTISVADVEELVGASRMEKVFGITDCIARRDAKGALALWEQVVATDRAAPYRSVGGLAVGFRRLAEAKRLVKGGTPPFEAAKKLGIWTDATRLKGQLDRFSLSQWQDQLVKLLRIDVASKTGLGDVETAVEKFIVELCACN